MVHLQKESKHFSMGVLNPTFSIFLLMCAVTKLIPQVTSGKKMQENLKSTLIQRILKKGKELNIMVSVGST